jgi:hypothetical protein
MLLIQSLRRRNAVRVNWKRLWPGLELEDKGEESRENMLENRLRDSNLDSLVLTGGAAKIVDVKLLRIRDSL